MIEPSGTSEGRHVSGRDTEGVPRPGTPVVTVASSPAGGPVGAIEPEGVAAPVTLRTIERMVRAGTAFACLTCYDFSTARWLERAGVHVLLVGDTAAEMILGLPRTIDMPLEVLLALTAAVKRGGPRTLVMGDMPFMSYQADDAEGIRNAGRFMTQGLADVVKIEADATFAPMVEKMARAGIPVCGHVGSRPQRAAMRGGYTSSGRTADETRRIVADAVALEQAGAVMLLVEAVPDETTDEILRSTHVPLIGIGAGTRCHGQVLVLHDLIGLTDWKPRFAEPVASVGEAIATAGREWVRRVATRSIGGRRYEMAPGEADRLQVEASGSAFGPSHAAPLPEPPARTPIGSATNGTGPRPGIPSASRSESGAASKKASASNDE